MFFKLLLCVAAIVALVQEPVGAMSYEDALLTLEGYLQLSAYSDSPVENVRAIKSYNDEYDAFNPHGDDEQEIEVFHLFGEMKVEGENLCSAQNSQTVHKLDQILEGKVCTESPSLSNRIEKIVHQVCQKWATECNAGQFGLKHN